MPELTQSQLDLLTKGGETFLHYHPRHIMDADDVYNLQVARVVREVVDDYVLTNNDEFLLVDTSVKNITITLPHSEFQREYQIIKTASAHSLTIVPTAPDTIMGSTSTDITGLYSSLRLKMYVKNRNWFLIAKV